MFYFYQGSARGRKLQQQMDRNIEMVSTALLPAFIFTWTVLFSPGIASEFVVLPCDQMSFGFHVKNCLSDFNKSMETSGYQEKCPWPNVRSIYIKLKTCVENYTSSTWCNGSKFLVDELFLEVHRMYFPLCGEVHDPPFFTLVMLIAPVIVATLFLPLLCVRLATWNT
ncbi:receptor activity-modifying protein 1 [Leuresthes tenuis]|uniref:receptor activity-modifying protein 1 n=1 Tax=Leuresthes tenuis TaxID=355514 RepID=UPI003B507DCB